MTAVALAAAVVLAVAGCQGASVGGGGGGGQPGTAGEATAGKATYNQVCAQCHGTPGADDSYAPDLAGTSADAMAAKVTSNDHGGGRIEGFLDRHYQEMAAYLGGGGYGGDGDDGGWDGGEDGGDDGGWGSGADLATACYFATDYDIQSVRQSVQNDYLAGVSWDDEVYMMAQGCQYNANVYYDDCVECAVAIADAVYP